MRTRTIAAIALVAGLSIHTQSFAARASDPDQAARQTWRAVMANTPVQGKGCFHASYPKVAWESQACKVAAPRKAPVHAHRTGAPESAGNGYDYVAQAQGLITFAAGQFSESGVTSETGLPPCPICVNDGPLPNEYSLQLNTNYENYSAACGDYSDCVVWQQFIYATDYNYRGEAALFMQYWLTNWTGRCPDGWRTTDDNFSCFRNSSVAGLPDIPVTLLSQVTFYGAANGDYDSVGLQYADDVWVVTANDSSSDNGRDNDTSGGGVDIASVWTQAELNVVGGGNSAQATFNNGAEFTVLLTLEDGSRSAPTCIPPQDYAGSTAESNNLTLGTCQTGVANSVYLGCGGQDDCVGGFVTGPYIEFTEKRPSRIEVTCIVCGSPIANEPLSLQVAPVQLSRAATTLE